MLIQPRFYVKQKETEFGKNPHQKKFDETDNKAEHKLAHFAARPATLSFKQQIKNIPNKLVKAFSFTKKQ